ncbi:MAG: hypothetical protein V3S24_22290 [Candidatus Tectomicrobia bacterium]
MRGHEILVESCSEVLWLDDDQGETIRRVERLGGKRLRLICDNPAHSTQEVEHMVDHWYKDVQSGVTMDIYIRGLGAVKGK